MKKDIKIFISYIQTLIYFYVFRRFRDWDFQHIEFFDKSFEPKNTRDLKLKNKIIYFNIKRLNSKNLSK